jgi:hypothetical protein
LERKLCALLREGEKEVLTVCGSIKQFPVVGTEPFSSRKIFTPHNSSSAANSLYSTEGSNGVHS